MLFTLNRWTLQLSMLGIAKHFCLSPKAVICRYFSKLWPKKLFTFAFETRHAWESNAVRDIFKSARKPADESADRRCGSSAVGWFSRACELITMDPMIRICASGNFNFARRKSRSLMVAAGAMLIAVGAWSMVSDAEPLYRGASEGIGSPSRTPAMIDGWQADTSIAPGRGGNRGASSDDISGLIEAAGQAESRGHLDIAQRLYEQVIAKEPNSVEAMSARRRLGAIYSNDNAVQVPAQDSDTETGTTVTLSPLPDIPGGHKPSSLEAASEGMRSTDLEANALDAGLSEPGLASSGAAYSGAHSGATNSGASRDVRDASLTTPEPPAVADNLLLPQSWRGRARVTNRFEQLLRADVGDRIFFGTRSAAIGSRARSVLERQAEWLARYPDLYVVVEGHSDEPGNDADNNAIARQRAETARRLLIEVGMKPEKVDIEVRGRTEPVATCESSDCRSQNRRAVIRLMLVLPERPGDRSSVNRTPGDHFSPG